MLLLGIDLGTSSIKISVIDSGNGKIIASAQFPEQEEEILSPQPGWAEQSPDQWWENVIQAILKCHSSNNYDPRAIGAMGIAYQMHGLVLVDKAQNVLRNSIIWCDSRAVDIGNKAFSEIGEERCLSRLLNSPGNFTASKLAWVKQNEPFIFDKINKIMLPGDYISMKMTGECTTTVSALSEGIFWDFQENNISSDILDYFGFDKSLFPAIQEVFSTHGLLNETVAARLSLKPGIPVTYKAGDQPNNAFALNVLQPGEVAATAGTSGVIYAVSSELRYDIRSRINSFAHVNYRKQDKRIGVLLCINGAGIFNRWIKNVAGSNLDYDTINRMAASVAIGSEGLITFPFGNGAERMLDNRIIGAHFHNLDLNKHHLAHMARAVQEGIAFAFRYGLDILRKNGMEPSVIRAGRSNLFLSDVFTSSFINSTGVSIEFYEGDGSYGAAVGAGVGAGIYKDAGSSLKRKPIHRIDPTLTDKYENLYRHWKEQLEIKIAEPEWVHQ